MNPLAALEDFLKRRQADTPWCHGLVVGLSAGPDSLALLLAAADIAPKLNFSLRALHVHHGLHADADAWAAQAQAQATAAGVPLDILHVAVTAAGSGIEAAARQARYDALAQAMQPDEALLLGHHQDDQAETVLLRLMRGAGLRGLAGMQECSIWPGPPSLLRWRPWLTLPRATLTQWLPKARACRLSRSEAAEEGASDSLAAVSDPANNDPRFARTALRHDILPRLQAHWPQAQALLARSANQLAQQQQVLDAYADDLLALLVRPDSDTLSISALSRLSTASLQVALSRWLQQRAAGTLPHRYWPRVTRELLQAKVDAQPCLSWPGWSLRRYRDALYLTDEVALATLDSGAEHAIAWPDPRQPIQLAGRLWTLDGLCPGFDSALDHGVVQRLLALPWRIARRQGGEQWQPAGRGHHITLKHWCQEQGIPPWQRAQLYCVWAGDEIVAVLTETGEAYPGHFSSASWQRSV